MSSHLFVTDEDGDTEMNSIWNECTNGNGNVQTDHSNRTSTVEYDDPVVNEIPINLTVGPCPVHVLQFANKPKKKMDQHPPVAGVRYKEASNVWEVDLPLNTQVFFDKEKASEKWNDVQVQTLRGVAVSNDMSQYVGVMKEGQLYLIPVERVAQMRPYFTYIDTQQQVRKDEDAKSRPVNPNAKKNQVITMSVKSSSEANQSRLGGALLAHKVADEEESKNLEWKDDTFDAFLEEVTKEEASLPLKPMDNRADYLSRLF